MKKSVTYLISGILLTTFVFGIIACRNEENPVVYQKGIFPDSLVSLTGLNSDFDDYNISLYTLNNYLPLIFSSNRASNGEQFDLVQGVLVYTFDQTTGDFQLQSEISDNQFFNELTSMLTTSGNDFGPYRLYSSLDGFEYTIASSVNDDGNLDFHYVRNLPYFGAAAPAITGPFPAIKVNSIADDAYICFDTNQDSAYFCSDADGDFDIYLLKRDASENMDSWLNSDYETPVRAETFNSPGNDKCPYLYRKILVFTSDRPGGLGGYDLYYSIFSGGRWSSPVNFGPRINSSSNEYRPVLGGDEQFSNQFMIFSSDRPGGKGGFDLYFTGIKLAG